VVVAPIVKGAAEGDHSISCLLLAGTLMRGSNPCHPPTAEIKLGGWVFYNTELCCTSHEGIFFSILQTLIFDVNIGVLLVHLLLHCANEVFSSI
jgi:hypothetical protein